MQFDFDSCARLALPCACCCCCLAGQPPKRLQTAGGDNINDVLNRMERMHEMEEDDRLQNDENMQKLSKRKNKNSQDHDVSV